MKDALRFDDCLRSFDQLLMHYIRRLEVKSSIDSLHFPTEGLPRRFYLRMKASFCANGMEIYMYLDCQRA